MFASGDVVGFIIRNQVINDMALISLRKYAKINEKDYGNIYRKYKRGDFETARKVGDVVLIDEDEPYCDKRFVTGRYVGYRENVRIGKQKKSEEKNF